MKRQVTQSCIIWIHRMVYTISILCLWFIYRALLKRENVTDLNVSEEENNNIMMNISPI